jgi:hypothetical protein
MTAIAALLDVTAERGGAATLDRGHRMAPFGRQRTQRLGKTSKPFAVSERLTISTDSRDSAFANCLRNSGP